MPQGPYHRLQVNYEPASHALYRAYELAFTRAGDASYVTRAGTTHAWALDMKKALAHHDVLEPIATGMAAVMRLIGLDQLAGLGYGSAFLIGAVAVLDPGIRVSIVRDRPKAYGFRRSVEGDVDPRRPTMLVDDIVNSGRSAAATARLLRGQGHDVVGVLAVFDFAWGEGRRVAARESLAVQSMATLHRDRVRTPSADLPARPH